MLFVAQILDAFRHSAVSWLFNSHLVSLLLLQMLLYCMLECIWNNYPSRGARRGIQPSISRDSGQPSYLLLVLLFFIRYWEQAKADRTDVKVDWDQLLTA